MTEFFESCFGPPVQGSFQDQIEDSSNISKDFLEFIFELPYQGCGKTCFETHCSQQVQGAPEKYQKVNAQILKQHFQSRGAKAFEVPQISQVLRISDS